MPAVARVVLLLPFLLLAACSSAPPAPPVPTVPANPPQVSSPLANDVLFRALGLVGTPYRWGGNTPDSGFDCSGLIGYVYRDVAGLRLPRSTREMIRVAAPGVERGRLVAGDLVFFATNGGRQVSHAGIYVGEGRFVHAPSSGGTVRLDSLSADYWRNSYLGAKRVLEGPALASNP